VAYGVTALPLVDPTTRWELLPIAYQETPTLGKSPNIARALREVIELVETTETPLAARTSGSSMVSSGKAREGGRHNTKMP